MALTNFSFELLSLIFVVAIKASFLIVITWGLCLFFAAAKPTLAAALWTATFAVLLLLPCLAFFEIQLQVPFDSATKGVFSNTALSPARLQPLSPPPPPLPHRVRR